MAERNINLGNQRLILGQNLGDDFVGAVESGVSIENPPADAVRQWLFNHPDGHLIDYRINVGDGYKEVEASLVRQMGLPPGSILRDMEGRLTGRERDFMMVVVGLGILPQKEQERIKRALERWVKVESLLD